MIKLLLIFIVLYVSFMAVAVNYAKAFRVKNQVINIIEQYQYDGTDKDHLVIEKIDDYLGSVAYAYGNNNSVINNCKSYGVEPTGNGVCIVPVGDEDSRYYKVITYIAIDFPFFNISMVIPIKGETKIIHIGQREEKV